MKDREVVLSGIRPTGKMHLGNYVGALRNFAEMSKDPNKECFFFLANYHALTTTTAAAEMEDHAIEVVLSFLACGVDLMRSTIYAQSSVPEITELSWLLACISPLGPLFNMPHFKEKKEKMREKGFSENTGLLTYPVLMAADILAVKATLVPVGDDQLPHLEFTRDVAAKFNRRHGKIFPLPDGISDGGRLPGLTLDGKMGKSDQEGVIRLSDTPEEIWEKIKIVPTDPQRERRSDPGDPAKCPIIYPFHQFFSDDETLVRVQQECRSAEIGCVECKKLLSNAVVEIVEPIRQKRIELTKLGRDSFIDILRKGGRGARETIRATVAEAKEKAGVPFY